MKENAGINEKAKQNLSGLPLSKINWATGILTVLCSVLLLVVSGRVSSAYEGMLEAEESYLSWQDSASDMEAASSYLTEQVRFFVITGKRAYLDNYFQETEVTRRREKAINSLRRERLVRSEEEAKKQLSIAKEKSVKLEELEYLAMRLVAPGFGYSLEELPEKVREVFLPEELEALPPEEQLSHGQLLVFDQHYLDERNSIQQTVDICFRILETARERNQTQATAHLTSLLFQQRVLVFVLILMVMLTILLNTFLIIGPVTTGVSYIRAEQLIPVKGAKEFRFLAETYNRIYSNNQKSQKQLSYEVKHDPLTRVLNRSGYENILQTANLRTSALLLIDVDKFKGINDTYGHKIGDKILKKVASSLTENFRSDDAVCRIGGDEFAVLMEQTGVERWELIRDKVNRINEKLTHPADNLPPVSISVGVAFGNCWKTTGLLDKDADLALYQVKENGRCGVAYYG